ncbi:hypothetical protein ADL25_03530 [Streptomyces sp. NRRL F-5122]|uniref:hypothetical protein n=1 Tax=Streptomyces sp. NRRL F-5122 TaxID=1609098 RepID=UPI0007412743|nr:hypothetical protein [Streptomyces sp. NRRL F-5122]KUJ58385.1 hypothetical protein ADL25_03530 [Streptomyces sp. NRRL F-5122]
MDDTRIAQRAEELGAPITDAEREQAAYALGELARGEGDPDALRVSHEQLALGRPFFELGWAMGVRNGHTGPAMAGVPVDSRTVTAAFILLGTQRLTGALAVDPQDDGPVLWQKVDYHGSLTQHHGTYWVTAIHAHADTFGEAPELRYDLSKMTGWRPAVVARNVRRRSLTPLPCHRMFA